MNKDFEKEYKKLIEEDPPELWDRIEKMVNAAIAEGASADTEEAEGEETLLSAAAAEAATDKPEEAGEENAESKPEEAAGEDASGENAEGGSEEAGSDDSEDSEKKNLIVGAFGGAAAEKEAADQADTGKKKKTFNWRRWVLPAAALLCVAIMIPVVITISRDRSKTSAEATSNAAASAQSDSAVRADAEMSAMAEAVVEAGAANGASTDDKRAFAPEYKEAVKVEPATDGEYEFIVEEEAAEGDDDYSDEDGGDDDEEWDDEDWEDDYEDEEELVNAYICISIDEDTPASVIDEIAAQFGLTNLGFDEEFEEYHLSVSEAMTEEALDELIDAIAENENVWCVYWDYADE